MTRVMSAKEYAEYSGADLAALEAAIEEAQNDAITRDSMDAASIRTQNFSDETEAKMRQFLEAAETASHTCAD